MVLLDVFKTVAIVVFILLINVEGKFLINLVFELVDSQEEVLVVFFYDLKIGFFGGGLKGN